MRAVVLVGAGLLLALGTACLERPGRRSAQPDGDDSTVGGLCLVPPPASTGFMGAPDVGEVKVRVDRREPVTLEGSPVTMRYMSTADKHLVAVFEDGKQAAAFSFTFQEKGSNRLCLFKHGLHHTWQIWDQHRAASVSPCTCRL